MNIMIYGAGGYTGRLIADSLKGSDLNITLAGRSKSTFADVSSDTGFEAVELSLDDPAALQKALANIDIVLHCAGPFSATSKPMIDACLAAKAHYLDITGEAAVFEAAAGRDGEAKAAGIMIMPGVGFDVVPSDCLAAHMKKRLPDATELTIAIRGLNKSSRGTAKTAIESFKTGILGRRNGKLINIEPVDVLEMDYEGEIVECLPVTWGDLSTAYHSTGIPNITTAFEASPKLRQVVAMPALMKWFFATAIGQNYLKKQADKRPAGPSEEHRQSGRGDILAIARNAGGKEVRSRLLTSEGYHLTRQTAVEIVKQVAAGNFIPGFQTPSSVFGPDFILGFENCTRKDLD